MPYFAVSRAVDDKKNNIGLGLLNTETKEFRLVPIGQITQALEKHLIAIENLEVVNGELKGSNGDIDRLPMVTQRGDLSDTYKCTIINEVLNGDFVVAYDVAYYDGAMGRLPHRDVVLFGDNGAITNGKVVNINGKKIISSIKGSYNTIVDRDTMNKAGSLVEKMTSITPNDLANKPKENRASSLFKGGFNDSNLTLIRRVLEESFKNIKELYGVDLGIGGISFTSNRFTARLEGNILPEGKTKEEVAFEEWANRWGMKPTDLGRQFTDGNKIFKITGARPNADKYKIIALNVKTGKEFVYTVASVRDNLI